MTWHEYFGWWLKSGEVALVIIVPLLLVMAFISWCGKHI
jgi:hypothetical protein